MSEICKEALAEACAEKVKQLEFSVKQSAFDSVRQELDTELAIARVALAALRDRAEPVAWMKRSIREAENWDSVDPEFVKSPEGWMSDYLPLYAEQPAPVVPGEMSQSLASIAVEYQTTPHNAQFIKVGWNAYRDAMLDAGALRERAEPVAYADPRAFSNFRAGTATKEWMWARPDAGLVPVFVEAPPAPVELTVWYGAMPESNGKTNWTAILHRKGEPLFNGITIECSEYPDRVRYEADRMRYLIGELAERPCILYYDADKHSGYVAPKAAAVVVPDLCSFDGLDKDSKDYETARLVGQVEGWNAFRTAMLQGKTEPVSQPYKLPSGWIKCSERLPEKDGNYWAWWSESKRQGPAWFIKSELQAQFQSSEITHWMPLPAAPKVKL